MRMEQFPTEHIPKCIARFLLEHLHAAQLLIRKVDKASPPSMLLLSFVRSAAPALSGAEASAFDAADRTDCELALQRLSRSEVPPRGSTACQQAAATSGENDGRGRGDEPSLAAGFVTPSQRLHHSFPQPACQRQHPFFLRCCASVKRSLPSLPRRRRCTAVAATAERRKRQQQRHSWRPQGRADGAFGYGGSSMRSRNT